MFVLYHLKFKKEIIWRHVRESLGRHVLVIEPNNDVFVEMLFPLLEALQEITAFQKANLIKVFTLTTWYVHFD
jgi:hypothetical protein